MTLIVKLERLSYGPASTYLGYLYPCLQCYPFKPNQTFGSHRQGLSLSAAETESRNWVKYWAIDIILVDFPDCAWQLLIPKAIVWATFLGKLPFCAFGNSKSPDTLCDLEVIQITSDLQNVTYCHIGDQWINCWGINSKRKRLFFINMISE